MSENNYYLISNNQNYGVNTKGRQVDLYLLAKDHRIGFPETPKQNIGSHWLFDCNLPFAN